MPLGTSPGVSKACRTSPTVVVGDGLHLYLQGCAATGARSCVGNVTLSEKTWFEEFGAQWVVLKSGFIAMAGAQVLRWFPRSLAHRIPVVRDEEGSGRRTP